MADDIDIRIKVDATGAISLLDKTGQAIKVVGEQSDRAGGGINLFGNLLMGMAQGIGQALLPKLTAIPGALLDIISSGADIADINDSFKSMAEAAGASSDVLVTQLQDAMGGTISKVDLASEAIKGFRAGLKPDEIVKVTQAARQFAEEVGGNAKDELDGLLQSLQKGDDRFLKTHGILIDNNTAFKEYALSIGKTADKLTELEKAEALRTAQLKAMTDAAAKGARIQNDAADNIKVFNTALTDAKNKFSEALAGNEELNKALASLVKLVKDTDFSPFITGVTRVTSEIFILTSQIASLTEKWLLSPLSWGSKESSGLKLLIGDLASFIGGDAPSQFSQVVKDWAYNLEGVAFSAEKAKDSLASIVDLGTIGSNKTTSSVGSKAGSGSLLEAPKIISAERLAPDPIDLTNLYTDLGSMAAGAFSDSMAGHFGREEIKQLMPGLFEAVGSALGAPGAGSALGTILQPVVDIGKTTKDTEKAIRLLLNMAIPGYGELLYRMSKSLGAFLGDSEGTAMKKKADGFFAKAFEANSLALIIDGELKKVSDLLFNGNQLGGMFDTLPETIKGSFQGIGTAFESLLGITGDLGVNIGNVLANNVGGSLNNLQLLVESTGKSFEDLKGAVIESFLDGKLSIDEALTSLHGIEQVSQNGIPDGLGMVDTAFRNIQAAGTKGGRALIDALKDVGYEAKELGIRDFRGLVTELQKRMPEASDEIYTLFVALENAGISTIDKLTGATTEQLLPALSEIGQQGFSFAKVAADAQQLYDKLSELDGKNIAANVKLNVTTNWDGNTQKLVNTGAVTAEQIGGAGQGRV